MYFPCYHNQGGEWGFAHFIWVFGIEIFIWGILYEADFSIDGSKVYFTWCHNQDEG